MSAGKIRGVCLPHDLLYVFVPAVRRLTAVLIPTHCCRQQVESYGSAMYGPSLSRASPLKRSTATESCETQKNRHLLSKRRRVLPLRGTTLVDAYAYPKNPRSASSAQLIFPQKIMLQHNPREGPITGTIRNSLLLVQLFRSRARFENSGDCVAPPRSSLFTIAFYCSRSKRVFNMFMYKRYKKACRLYIKRRQAVHLRGTTLVELPGLRRKQSNCIRSRRSTQQSNKQLEIIISVLLNYPLTEVNRNDVPEIPACTAVNCRYN